jgi:hypothetical protein
MPVVRGLVGEGVDALLTPTAVTHTLPVRRSTARTVVLRPTHQQYEALMKQVVTQKKGRV